MEIKVGQWVRLKPHNVFNTVKIESNNQFQQVNQVFDNGNIQIIDNRKGVIMTIKGNYVIKVADIPQELVAVGDLVEVLYQHNNKVLPLALVTDYNNEFVFTLNAVVRKERIVSIYTPNEDRTQYTEQWRNVNE